MGSGCAGLSFRSLLYLRLRIGRTTRRLVPVLGQVCGPVKKLEAVRVFACCSNRRRDRVAGAALVCRLPIHPGGAAVLQRLLELLYPQRLAETRYFPGSALTRALLLGLASR